MSFETIPASDIPLSEQADAFNAAFAGYLVPLGKMDAAGLARFLCAQGADLCHSRFVCAAGTIAGFGYINRIGNVSRLAGMGTVPDARRTGVGSYLLSKLLEEAKMRGDAAMMLEVFEQNASALMLYRRYAFKEKTRLLGWRRTAKVAAPQSNLNEAGEISVIDASRVPNALEYPDIPWQITRYAVLKAPGARAFGDDKACVVIGGMAGQPIRVHAFFAADKDEKRLRSILDQVIQQFPDCEFFAPAVFPEHFGREIFEPLGFAREPLNQLLMRRDL